MSRAITRFSPLSIIFVMAWIILSQNGVHAATWTWTGGSAVDANWTQPDNWNPIGPPASANDTSLIFSSTGNPRPSSTHGPFTLNSVNFPALAGTFTLAATGPLTFAGANPSITQSTDVAETIAGDIIIPPATTLTLSGTPNENFPTLFGNAAGSTYNGGGTRGGAFTISRPATIILDNSKVTPGTRALELDTLTLPTTLPVFQVANEGFNGPGIAWDVNHVTGIPIIQFKNTGTLGMTADIQGGLLIHGGQVLPDGKPGSRITTNGGLAITGVVTVPDGAVLLDRETASPASVTMNFNISASRGVGAQGTVYVGAADADPTHTLIVGDTTAAPGNRKKLTAFGDVILDNTLGATGNVSSKLLLIASDIVINSGTVDIRNSANITSGHGIQIDGDIIAAQPSAGFDTLKIGVPVAPLGVTFNGNLVMNGSLRVEGPAASVAGFLTPARLSGMTGSANSNNYLAPSPSDAPFDLQGVTWPLTVGLLVRNSNLAGTDVRLSGGASSTFNRSVEIESGATLDASNDTLSALTRIDGSATITGPVTITKNLFLASAASPKLLTVEGNLTLADGLVLSPGTDGKMHVTGNLLLDNPLGVATSGPLLSITGNLAPLHGQSLPLVVLDTGHTLTGRFEALEDGTQFNSALGGGYIIHYNVDSGDGSANDIVLTFVPEPTAIASLGFAIAIAFLRRRVVR
jgi:hypothetical protein